MVKIRLQRVGTKNRPFYRVVVADSRSKRDGRFIEIVGQYHPLNPKGNRIKIKNERVDFWIKQGAQPTDVVNRILKNDQTETPAIAS